MGCRQASNFDQQPAPKGDDPVVMYPPRSYRYSGAETWSRFDARLAEKVVNSRRLFTPSECCKALRSSRDISQVRSGVGSRVLRISCQDMQNSIACPREFTVGSVLPSPDR